MGDGRKISGKAQDDPIKVAKLREGPWSSGPGRNEGRTTPNKVVLLKKDRFRFSADFLFPRRGRQE